MKYAFILIAFTFSLFSYSQSEIQPCSQWEETEKLFNNNPSLKAHAMEKAKELELFTQQYQEDKAGAGTVYTIPVVYHVIYQSPESNISDEQIYSSIEVLNRDFRLLNTDYLNAPEQFSSIAADIEIEFRLAKIDPEGNCTKGINRIQSALTYDGGADMKALIHWPRNKYLNIWICSAAGGAAGYTFLPSSTDGPWMADQDGIVLLHSYTGAIGTSNSSASRTLSHEVGHWLNLSHVWGGTNTPELASNCNEDDNVADTPLTTGHSGTCNQSLESCGSLDNINNYMEYTACKWMFTQGQRSRMRAAVVSGISDRNQLWQESNLIATGVLDNEELLCIADFNAEVRDGCTSNEFAFEDESFNSVIERTWNFGDGTTYSTTDPEEFFAYHTYSSPGIYTVAITVSDGITELTESKSNFITVLDPDYIGSTLIEGFQNDLDEMKWTIENSDNDETWEIYNNAGLESSKCLRLRNYYIDFENAKDVLKSSTMDVTGNDEVYVTYSWAFAQKTSTNTDDKLKVYISYNCGETWVLKKIHRGITSLPTVDYTSSPFIPNDNSDWDTNTITITNPNQITENFRVKFEFTAKGGNNMYLDNINVYGNTQTGVNELSNRFQFALFPNPTSNDLTITFPNEWKNMENTITISDLSGRIIREFTTSNTTLATHLNDVPKGIYFVKITSEVGQQFTKKLIVQ